jgi:hypothetical protein
MRRIVVAKMIGLLLLGLYLAMGLAQPATTRGQNRRPRRAALGGDRGQCPFRSRRRYRLSRASGEMPLVRKSASGHLLPFYSLASNVSTTSES